ncbi:unnamed protein product [Kuraishia capsulata CBS 1993]|uniref:Protein-serine/threonine kinase n=1 Tax=Kuraishia capsulata CBS 1993 TaxID=1382522 RepID=W6MNN4_9ASCO|nr:uncharacterized protein KUCA_T00004261001 [Kuraishia capsulata CBS 1993]CDK28279.1 unnamed protein product [Kuraishia capsulata CBS 1993]
MSHGWKLTQSLREEIYKYAKFPPTGVSLRQMVQFGPKPSAGTLFHASQFVVEELPIRLAHRVKELEELPNDLNKVESIQLVRDWYAQSFEELTSLPKPTIDESLRKLLYGNGNNNLYHPSTNSNPPAEDESATSTPLLFDDDGLIVRKSTTHKQSQYKQQNQFLTTEDYIATTKQKRYYIPCPINETYPAEVYEYNRVVTDTLKVIKKRHDATVTTVAKGVQEWKHNTHVSLVDTNVQSFLDRFYLSRIGIRMLIGQQIAINQDHSTFNDDYVGVICLNTNVAEIAQDAIESARFTCEEHYGLMEAPQVQLYCPTNLNFMYVPGHLVHMLFETLKNSLRATVEHHLKQNLDKDIEDIQFPPVKIIVAEGEEDITIKISDEGGGIARSAMPLIWTYLYTTVEALPVEDPWGGKTDFRAPMAGYGYGLPISRLYARYFGGDLKLISMEGYGTDVYLHLNRLSSSSEPLP